MLFLAPSILIFYVHFQVIISVMATVAASLLCFAGAVFSLTNVAPMLSSFEKCQYFPKEFSCRCFFSSDLRQVSYIFRGTNNCKVVQFDLKNMVYGISGVYGAGLALCLVAGIMECLLMCRSNSKSKVYKKLHLQFNDNSLYTY